MATSDSTLGPQVARYGYARSAGVRRWLLAAILLLVAAGCVALVMYAERAPPSPRETPEQRRAAQYAFLGIAAACVAIAIVSAIGIRRERHVELRLHERGFAYRGPRDDVARDFPWDRVDAFTHQVVTHDVHGVPVRTIHRYTVARRDGGTAVLGDELADVAAIADVIAARTLPLLLAAARATIDRGGTVTFGPLSAVREGLVIDGLTLAWADLAPVHADVYGALVVRPRRGGPGGRRIDYARLTNGHVLLALAAERVR